MSSIRIADFDTFRPGYGLASVRVVVAGTDDDADIFSDENLTLAVANPQVLIERIIGGVSYGKFSAPVYVGVPCELIINQTDQTGVIRIPINSLDAEDVSDAVAQPTGGSISTSIDDLLARRIDVRDFGAFVAVGGVGASTSTNAATLAAALAAASALGGGFVETPAGSYDLTTLTIPQGVVLRGQGRAATTLRSTQASAVFTIGGSRAGFSRITLDGVTLVGSSIGVYAASKDEIVFDDVEIKRFATGIDRRGGANCEWRELFISNCTTGYKLYGDAASGAGTAVRYNVWRGGRVELCTSKGIDIRYVDAACEHNTFYDIIFDTNTGNAVDILGARWTVLHDCRWTGNTNNLTVNDASPATSSNTVIGLDIVGGSISSGSIALQATLEKVAFRAIEFTSVAVTITTPIANILVHDCRETSTTIAGSSQSWTRSKSHQHSAGFVLTSDATVTKVWSINLDPGQYIYLEGKIIARQRNGSDSGFYHIVVSAGRFGSALSYDAQTANFTIGLVVTGATSGATARIISDTDAGATGALGLQDVVGTFLDNEVITDTGGGSALVNGPIAHNNASLAGTNNALRAAQESDATWNAVFAANATAIELQVLGAAAKTIEWTAHVDVVSNDPINH